VYEVVCGFTASHGLSNRLSIAEIGIDNLKLWVLSPWSRVEFAWFSNKTSHAIACLKQKWHKSATDISSCTSDKNYFIVIIWSGTSGIFFGHKFLFSRAI
jgi:hypothetical protein